MTNMATADEIRYFVTINYIEPARSKSGGEICIRLGDVRQGMTLANPLQSVRSALSTETFQRQAGVELLNPVDHRTGADTIWRFHVQGTPTVNEFCRKRLKFSNGSNR